MSNDLVERVAQYRFATTSDAYIAGWIAALEEAAKVADKFGAQGNDDVFELAAAIRAMIKTV